MKTTILFLLHLPPPVHGSSVVGQFIKESELINNNFSCEYINLLASKKVGDSGKISFRKLSGSLIIWFRLFGILIRKRPDLCYIALTTTGTAFYRDTFIVFLLKLFQVKRIFHLHNKGVSCSINHPLKRLIYRNTFKDAEVILLSKLLYTDIQDVVSKDNIHICPNGIPEEGKVSNAHKRKSKSVQILFLSNLIESKGVYVLLEACSLLMNKGISFNCIFIGGEGDITTYKFSKKVRELGLQNHINYLGKKFGMEKYKAFANADIFVLPTSNDTFGLVNIEAMQFSLPVISTYEGGIPDVVEDGVTGYLVPQKDAKALAEKLKILIKDPELRHEMGRAGRLKYEQEFTLEIFELRLKEILNQVSEK